MKNKFSLMFAISLFATTFASGQTLPSLPDGAIIPGPLYIQNFGSGLELVGYPSVELVNDSTIFIRSFSATDGVAITELTYSETEQLLISFDWVSSASDPNRIGENYYYDAGYRIGLIYTALGFADSNLIQSGSVSIEKPAGEFFRFYISSIDGGGQFSVGNLSYALIPEPSSCAALLGTTSLVLAFRRRKRRSSNGVRRNDLI